MKNLSVIPATIALMRAHFNRTAGKIAKAKVMVEGIQMRYPKTFEFLDAYYGFLLISERDIENASKFFDTNLKNLPENKNDNQKYIELYCKYFLGAGEENFDWEWIISEADQLKTGYSDQKEC